MAKQAARAPDLSTHPLVDKLRPDPNESPEFVTLVGYFGPSKNQKAVRLYADLTFAQYYEIPRDAVVNTAPVNPDDPHSPTIVRVRSDAQIQSVNVSSRNVKAAYLKGPISNANMGAALTAAQLATPGMVIKTHVIQCGCVNHTMGQIPPTSAIWCIHTSQINCHYTGFSCPSLFCTPACGVTLACHGNPEEGGME